MPITDRVWKCECGFVSREVDLICHEMPRHPKTGHSQEVLQCPECGSIEPPARLCDEEGCGTVAGGGSPDERGVYRWTCWGHSPMNTAQSAAVDTSGG